MKLTFRKRTVDVTVTEKTTIGDVRALASRAFPRPLRCTARARRRARARARSPTAAHWHHPAEHFRLAVERVELRSEAAGDAKPQKFSGDARRLGDALQLDGRALGGAALAVKDLGPQFSYRGVFLVEYAGPIAILLAFLARPAALFGAGARPLFGFAAALSADGAAAPVGSRAWNEFVQALAIALWVAHFAKRELETLFVHKFSRSHMPLSNLFKNSVYYWGFALAVGYPLVHPEYTAPSKEKVVAGAAVWALSQLVNFSVHWQLAHMRRKEGDADRAPPSGALFALVACPNYTAEVAGWVGWSLLSQITAGWVFTLVGFVQMADWALKKLAGYRKDDAAWARGRKALVPFVL